MAFKDPTPRSWQQAIDAAGYRLIGATQKEAAKGCGCSRDTVRRWESYDWWPRVVEEAREKYADDILKFARRTCLNAVREGDAKLALKILERLDQTFAPPKQQVEHSGQVGRPQMDETTYQDLPDEYLEEIERIQKEHGIASEKVH